MGRGATETSFYIFVLAFLSVTVYIYASSSPLSLLFHVSGKTDFSVTHRDQVNSQALSSDWLMIDKQGQRGSGHNMRRETAWPSMVWPCTDGRECFLPP